ncbi:MAG: hypothetical protein HYY16_17580 [Planctomycetes bacterium]|nr:hypothetical protein [Planctomycetota bacterium]
MSVSAPSDTMIKALRRMLAALKGMGYEPALIGTLAHRAWDCPSELGAVELLTPFGEAQRDAVLSAARGEGFKQSPDSVMPAAPGSFTSRVSYTDAKPAATVNLELREAATPYLKQVLNRAQRRWVFDVELAVATCEDLILMRAGSADSADCEDVIGLLRANAGRIDAQYMKREAEATGVFEGLKRAWLEAKRRG